MDLTKIFLGRGMPGVVAALQAIIALLEAIHPDMKEATAQIESDLIGTEPRQ